jgi:hypothetical protein
LPKVLPRRGRALPELHLESPPALNPEPVLAVLSGGPAGDRRGRAGGERKLAGGAGLRLIRDLLWHGYRTRARCEASKTKPTLLDLPVPLSRRKGS